MLKKINKVKEEKNPKIDIREFREKGYLQEINRRFLHPLGLGLEITIEDDGSERLSGIWDYREDDTGIYFDIKNSNKERKETFKKKYEFIESELKNRREAKIHELSYFIEEISE